MDQQLEGDGLIVRESSMLLVDSLNQLGIIGLQAMSKQVLKSRNI